MLNVKRLILLGLCIVMFGCTGLPPAPEEQYYSELVKEFPQAKSAIYSIKAYWYPDTYIQKFTGIYLTLPTAGMLYLTEDNMIYAIYITAQDVLLQAFQVHYSDITYFNFEKRGILDHYVTLQINGTNVHGFSVVKTYNSKGERVDNTEALDFIKSKLPK